MEEHAEYTELVEAARDAMRALLARTEPGTGLRLHHAYRDLGDMLTAGATHERTPGEIEQDRAVPADGGEREASQGRVSTWRDIPRARREALVFQVLGEDRLTIRMITERMEGELVRLGFARWDGFRACAVYQTEVDPVVKRMWRHGQLERAPETFNGSRIRHRYRRPCGMEGPIADLDRALRDVPADGEVA